MATFGLYFAHQSKILALMGKSMTIPEIIRHYRGDKTLRDFAAELDVTYEAIRQWEVGAKEPTQDRIDAFVKDQRPWVSEMGTLLFLSRHGSTLKRLIK